MRRTHQATRVQLQAQEAMEFYKEHIPLGIRLEVEKVVGDIWEEVKLMPKEDLRNEVRTGSSTQEPRQAEPHPMTTC